MVSRSTQALKSLLLYNFYDGVTRPFRHLPCLRNAHIRRVCCGFSLYASLEIPLVIQLQYKGVVATFSLNNPLFCLVNLGIFLVIQNFEFWQDPKVFPFLLSLTRNFGKADAFPCLLSLGIVQASLTLLSLTRSPGKADAFP